MTVANIMNHEKKTSESEAKAVPPAPPTSGQAAKLARRHSRQMGLFERDLLWIAFKRSFVMLRPDIQWKNPVMFVVEIGVVLTVLFTIATLLGYKSQVSWQYLVALDVWLFLTVLFANFAEALAEARGKAQAEALRKTRQETPAFRLRQQPTPDLEIRTTGTALCINQSNGADQVEEVASTELQAGDVVLVDAGQVNPGDGEIIEGVAS